MILGPEISHHFETIEYSDAEHHHDVGMYAEHIRICCEVTLSADVIGTLFTN